MAETVTLAGVTYTIPDPGDSPNWATGLTPYLVAIAANVASNPTFIQYVSVAATPTSAISGKCYLINTSSLAVTMNLPAPTQNTWFMFKDVSNNAATNSITLHRSGSEQIDGSSADKVLARSGGTWIVMSDGTNWWTINPYAHSGNDAGLVNADVAAGAALAYSKLALTGSILNADLAGSIAYSKLALTGAILNADLAGSIAYSKLILTGSIVNADVASSAAIAVSKLAALTVSRAVVTDAGGLLSAAAVTATELGYSSGVTSAIQTQLNGVFKYRRPNLVYGSATTVSIESGIVTGTSGDVTILFPDGVLRTTNNTTYTTLNIARVAVLTGTKQSGIRTGTAAANTWYAVYAVKSQDSNDVVTVADTVIPVQANYATLNTNFGTNGWVYLGTIAYGDSCSATTSIVTFLQNGNMTLFGNLAAGFVGNCVGVRVAGTSAAASVSWNRSAGTSIGSGQTPAHFGNLYFGLFGQTAGAGTQFKFFDVGTSMMFASPYQSAGTLTASAFVWANPGLGFLLASVGAATAKYDIFTAGWMDAALGVGSNPLM